MFAIMSPGSFYTMSVGPSVPTPVRMLRLLTWLCPGLSKRMKVAILLYDPLGVRGGHY